MTAAPFLISILSTTIGTLLFVGGVVQFFRQRARIARSVRTNGVVIELLKQRVEGTYIRTTAAEAGRQYKYLYRLVVEFETRPGHKVRFSPALAQTPPALQVGDSVTVLFEPDNPKQAQIHDFVHLWFSTLMLIVFGLFFTGLGLIGLV